MHHPGDRQPDGAVLDDRQLVAVGRQDQVGLLLLGIVAGSAVLFEEGLHVLRELLGLRRAGYLSDRDLTFTRSNGRGLKVETPPRTAWR